MADNTETELPVVDLAATQGYIVDDSDEDDPVLIQPDGTPVETWRENYPYEKRMSPRNMNTQSVHFRLSC